MHSALSRDLFDLGIEHLTRELCAERGWELHAAANGIVEITFRAPERRPIRPRFRFDHWNELPPSVDWLDEDGQPFASLPSGPGGQLNSSPHPITKRPFTCMAGVLEYHTHDSHITDLWDNYRDRPGYDLGGIITRVWRAWKGTSP